MLIKTIIGAFVIACATLAAFYGYVYRATTQEASESIPYNVENIMTDRKTKIVDTEEIQKKQIADVKNTFHEVDRKKYVTGAYTIQRSADAQGYAYTILNEVKSIPQPQQFPIERFELRHGDCAYEKDCNSSRERVERREHFEAKHGSTVEYTFSMLIPKDYGEMKPKQILGQWHDGTGPVISQRYEHGHLWLDIRTKEGKTTRKYDIFTGGLEKGRWLTFVYTIHWSKTQNGTISVSMNGKNIVNYSGPTITDIAVEPIYFKYGVYRSDVDTFVGNKRPTNIVYYSGYGWHVISN